MRRLVAAAVALFAIALPASAFSNGYLYSRAITVGSAVVPSTQVNFPMLVLGAYSYLATLPNGGMIQNTITLNSQAVPADLIFTSDAAGTALLNWEVASYSAATGTIEVWVQVPSLSNRTIIYMFYGNSSVTTYQGNSTNAWGGSYGAVWHMANGTTQSLLDSSGNGNTLASNGTSAGPGQIDGGIVNTGGQPNGLIVSSPNAINNLSSFSDSIWLNASALIDSAAQGELSLIAGNQYQLYINQTSGTLSATVVTTGSYRSATTTNSITASAWHYVVVTYSSGSYPMIYIDGAEATYSSSTNGTGTDVTSSAGVGVGVLGYNEYFYSFPGTLDEARIANVALSSAWITTEYNNQNSPSTFYAIGSVLSTAVSGTASIIM